MPDLIFSNYNYHLSETFNTLLRNYNHFLEEYKNPNKYTQEAWETWADMIQDDFYQAANKWLDENKTKTEWRKDLK